MNHSQMLTTRRRKQRTQKLLARVTKQAKKLGKKSVKAAKAKAPGKGSA